MDVAASVKYYDHAMEILGSCFGWRSDLMDGYEVLLDSGNSEALEVLAERIEAVHQVQRRAFDMLQVMSRHFLQVLDAESCLGLFEALSETPIDLDDGEAVLAVIRELASRAELTSEGSRKWLDDGLAELTDPTEDDLRSLVTGAVMLIISENFHEVVDRHQVLSDRMIELVHRARDQFPDLPVVPSDYIPVLNPGETARSAERTLKEYTETYLDPDMSKAYR